MPEVDKYLTFNALHMCIIVLLVNIINTLLVNGNCDYIINFINYLINTDSPRFWFIIIHIVLTCIILFYIKFEIIFYASMKFNL